MGLKNKAKEVAGNLALAAGNKVKEAAVNAKDAALQAVKDKAAEEWQNAKDETAFFFLGREKPSKGGYGGRQNRS